MKMLDKESQILLAVFGTLTIMFVAAHLGFTILFFKKYVFFVFKLFSVMKLFPIFTL